MYVQYTRVHSAMDAKNDDEPQRALGVCQSACVFRFGRHFSVVEASKQNFFFYFLLLLLLQGCCCCCWVGWPREQGRNRRAA